MMKRKYVLVLMLMTVTLVQTTPIWARSAASVQADCDGVSQAVRDEQNLFMKDAIPLQDPVKTFDDATSSCLDFIVGFQIGIPSLWDGLLSGMAKLLMQRVCQTARAQFDKAVGDAMQSVNGVVGQVPGVGVSTSSQGGSHVQSDGGTTMKNTVNNAVDRVINFVR